MKAAGIDGCRGGWLTVRAESGFIVSVELITHLSLLKMKPSEHIWIDIPIGIPSAASYPRKAEGAARKLIKSRSSSIFTVPCREVLYTAEYDEANRKHRELTGHGLSKQSWNLFSKIKEAEILAGRMKELQVSEAHPELVFYGMAGQTMTHSKKKIEGVQERLNILKNYSPNVEKHFDKAADRFLRKEAAKDDIIDAMALAVAASHPALERKTVLPADEHNETDRSMNIHYAVTTYH
ncbi:DUF429 domain-containing protein [Alkalicoccus saliphilus]|uniref:DUF429 domain-containing protein n=1 Tax=Alkalicoccus saliphilus TaxID=200989 RepID=A0A2T4U4D7_9BACI|nr:DUF429 domain-containing protein [Alkalicoccus saliphilus]PTL38263.1 hypothetical protein C6Y45_12110 [Alkalicoccus saliphilus]